MQPSPQDIQMFLSSLGDDQMAADLDRQIAEARALRNYQPQPFTSAGGVTVANVPGAISGMFVRGKGEKQARDAEAERRAMIENQRKVTAEYFNRVFQPQTGAVPPQTGYGPRPGNGVV